MTEAEFIKAIIDLYQNSRLTTYTVDNIQRCKNRTVSGFSEDLLALCISKYTNKENKILIESEISILIDNKKKKICPDVSISNGQTIGQLWDIKMDLGRQREPFIKFCNDKSELVTKLKNNSAKINRDDFIFSSNLTFNIVVVSDRNSSKVK